MDKAKQSLLNTGRYGLFVKEIEGLLAEARRQAARSVNAILTATYWEIGRRIVEFEQSGAARAEYGEHLLIRLARDLTAKCGRGFSSDNLELMRRFYLSRPPRRLSEATAQRPSVGMTKGKSETVSRKFRLADLAGTFPLSWSHYARLLKVQNDQARAFHCR